MTSHDLLTRNDLIEFENRILKFIQDLVKPAEPNRWLRSKDVQEMLRISSSSLQNMRNSGAIPYTKIEGTILYPLEDIQKILKK